MGASAAVVAAFVRKQRELVEHFQRAGAVSPTHARSSSDLGVEEGLAWRRLARDGVIREAVPGAYYLDESAWLAVGQRRRRVAFAVVSVFVALAAVLMIVTAIVARR